MARTKFDIVIEAVHYLPGGGIDWVRGYERRGATFSDRILFKRDEIIQRLNGGKKVYQGQRREFLASTFEISQPLRLVKEDGKVFLISGEVSTKGDCLSGVPVI
jgi:hypothetical protein